MNRYYVMLLAVLAIFTTTSAVVAGQVTGPRAAATPLALPVTPSVADPTSLSGEVEPSAGFGDGACCQYFGTCSDQTAYAPGDDVTYNVYFIDTAASTTYTATVAVAVVLPQGGLLPLGSSDLTWGGLTPGQAYQFCFWQPYTIPIDTPPVTVDWGARVANVSTLEGVIGSIEITTP